MGLFGAFDRALASGLSIVCCTSDLFGPQTRLTLRLSLASIFKANAKSIRPINKILEILSDLSTKLHYIEKF